MSVTYGFRDQEGTESKMLVHMTNPLFAIVDFVGFVEYLTYGKVTLANVVTQLSECDMTYIGLRLTERETTLGSYGTGEAEKKGVFLFSDAVGAPSFRMAIPGIKESVLAGNGRDIDLADAAVVAFINAMAAGGAGRPTTPNGVNITSPFAAYKQHRHSSKGGTRRTG
jgi:hypothetical protein